MKETSQSNNLMSVILLIYYCSLFIKFKFLVDLPPLGMFASFVYSSLSLALTFYFFFFKLQSYFKIQLFIFLLFIFGYITSVFSLNYRPQDYILNIQNFGIALIPLYYKLNVKLFKYTLYALLLFFFYYILNGIDPNEIFSVSRNTISIFLIISYCYYVIASVQNKKDYDIWPVFVSFFIAVWAVGRGGIVAIALLIMFLPYFRKLQLSFKVVIIYLMMLMAFYYVYLLYADTLLALAFSRFDSMGFDPNGRDALNSVYIKYLWDSCFNFFFGVNLPGIPVFEELDLNPHNSFIRLHIYYGIGGFILVMYGIILSFIKYIKTRNFVYALFLGVLLVRSYVDSTAFFGPFDGLIYYFIFFVMYEKSLSPDLVLQRVNSHFK